MLDSFLHARGTQFAEFYHNPLMPASAAVHANCPLPLFNLQEAQGERDLIGPLGEDSSAAASSQD
jgi:hypothetical protein